MYIGRDFTDMDVGEVEAFAFDFASDLGDMTISSTTWSIALIRELSSRPDNAVSAHLSGIPEYEGTRSFHTVSGLVAGNSYLLRANVVTNTNKTLSLWSHVKCVQPA